MAQSEIQTLTQSADDFSNMIVTEHIGDMVNLVVSNYFSGQLLFEKQLPVTTKGNTDDHGFGMKSMKKIAEKYAGDLSIDVDKDLFILSVYVRQCSAETSAKEATA